MVYTRFLIVRYAKEFIEDRGMVYTRFLIVRYAKEFIKDRGMVYTRFLILEYVKEFIKDRGMVYTRSLISNLIRDCSWIQQSKVTATGHRGTICISYPPPSYLFYISFLSTIFQLFFQAYVGVFKNGTIIAFIIKYILDVYTRSN